MQSPVYSVNHFYHLLQPNSNDKHVVNRRKVLRLEKIPREHYTWKDYVSSYVIYKKKKDRKRKNERKKEKQRN